LKVSIEKTHFSSGKKKFVKPAQNGRAVSVQNDGKNRVSHHTGTPIFEFFVNKSLAVLSALFLGRPHFEKITPHPCGAKKPTESKLSVGF
jgi:hypothetical protein